MEQQHIDTIVEALEYRLKSADIYDALKPGGFVDTIGAARKAVEALRAQAQPPQQPMDFPDGPGWWAGDLKHRQFVVHWTGFELKGDLLAIQWDEDSYFMRYSLADFKRDYQDCKWYRLTMPWEGA